MSSSTRGYRSLLVWQKAMDLADHVYDVTDSWPPSERYGLTNQSRRAAVSVASNIAEGQGRNSDGDFARFLDIAYGSLCELETQLLLAGRRDMLAGQALDELMSDSDEVARLIRGLTTTVRSRIAIREYEPTYDAGHEDEHEPLIVSIG